jgi:hypothetical protein
VAQWLGQFSGNTLKTAVLDAEELLRHAVSAFRNAPTADRLRKGKAVRALAKRLCAARVHFLKAEITAATDPAMDDTQPGRARQIARLEEALSVVQQGGIPAILTEFSANDALQAPD